MKDLNKIMLSGSMVSEPERSVHNTTVVCEFRMASNNERKNVSTGGKTDETLYINCLCFRALAESIIERGSIGSMVIVSGTLQMRETYINRKVLKYYKIVADYVRIIDTARPHTNIIGVGEEQEGTGTKDEKGGDQFRDF